jgi:hypothetical protein
MLGSTIVVFIIVLIGGIAVGVNPILSFIVATAAAFGRLIVKITIGI